MNMIPPKGWTIYGGGDGFDAIPDANGYWWWGDNMWQGDRSNGSFQFIVCRQKNDVSEIIPLPEKCNGAGRLNWTPAGLVVGVTNEISGVVTAKRFFMNQYVQFTNLGSVIVAPANTAVSTVDTQARTDASVSLQEARRATETAKTSLSMAQDAKRLSEAAAPLSSVTGIVETRIIKFLNALKRNDRSDTVNAYWMDIIFAKTNDWIFGWMKDHNKL